VKLSGNSADKMIAHFVFISYVIGPSLPLQYTLYSCHTSSPSASSSGGCFRLGMYSIAGPSLSPNRRYGTHSAYKMQHILGCKLVLCYFRYRFFRFSCLWNFMQCTRVVTLSRIFYSHSFHLTSREGKFVETEQMTSGLPKQLRHMQSKQVNAVCTMNQKLCCIQRPRTASQ